MATRMTLCRPVARLAGQRGLSLVELLVASAIGLFLALGATRLFTDHLLDNRRLLLEARLHQDLRAATDLVARDLRRAGHWREAVSGALDPARPNPYRSVALSGTSNAAALTYSFSRDVDENHALDLNEAVGFRLSASTLQALNGGSWQSLTDPAVVRLTRFAVVPEVLSVPLGPSCTPACSGAGCPVLRIRSYRIELQGHAVADPALAREIRESVRVRNDELVGSCP